MNIYKRFLKYISIDTQSDEKSNTIPSTHKQTTLAKLLALQLANFGLDIFTKNGTVYAKLNKNTNNKHAIGLIAHIDTAPDFNGANINPRLIENYDGNDIILNDNLNIVMDTKTFTSLSNNIGEDIIVTDGTSLLGADDKAGVAIIMEVINHLYQNPNIKHGDIYLAFTPDEEIGRGTDYFDFDFFQADFAYTIDGGDISIIEYETFNAASAIVTINGKNIHPGSAKNKMLNSIRIGEEFDNLLPENKRPEYTESYEGFNHLCSFNGNVEQTKLEYIIRNHDETLFNNQKTYFYEIANFLNKKYGNNTINVEIKDSYKNMAQYIKNDPICLEYVYKAYNNLNLPYKNEPIRGGTDGARLSEHGLLTPNLGTGGYNFHGKYEYLSLTQANKMCEIILTILQL